MFTAVVSNPRRYDSFMFSMYMFVGEYKGKIRRKYSRLPVRSAGHCPSQMCW